MLFGWEQRRSQHGRLGTKYTLSNDSLSVWSALGQAHFVFVPSTATLCLYRAHDTEHNTFDKDSASARSVLRFPTEQMSGGQRRDSEATVV